MLIAFFSFIITLWNFYFFTGKSKANTQSQLSWFFFFFYSCCSGFPSLRLLSLQLPQVKRSKARAQFTLTAWPQRERGRKREKEGRSGFREPDRRMLLRWGRGWKRRMGKIKSEALASIPQLTSDEEMWYTCGKSTQRKGCTSQDVSE